MPPASSCLRRRIAVTLFLAAACLGGGPEAVRTVRAEPDEASRPTPVPRADAEGGPAAVPPATIRETAPQLFYLQDDAGRLVPVPGFRYRDFVELFRLREGLPAAPQPAAAVLEELSVLVDRPAADGTAPVTVTCTVRQTRDGWVSVPLELPELLLSAPARYEGPGRFVLAAEPRQAGLLAWLEATGEAKADVRHRIVLEGRLPVDTTPISEAVALHLPTATAARLELATSRSHPEVAVTPVQQGRQVTVTAVAGGSTVAVAGGAGPMHVRVSDRDRVIADAGVPEVEVESVVQIDGRNAVITAVLRLAHLDPAVRRIRVAPPAGAVLRAVRGGAWIGGVGAGEAGAVAELALDAHEGSVQIELDCERAIDSTGAIPFEVVGFALDGVPPWRQWGRLSLVVQGEWQAEWDDDTSLRRIDPPVAVRQAGLVAAFAFDAQPASLPVRIRPRRSRVVIEPEYRFDVAATRVALEGRLRVAVAGAPATGIVVEIDPAWAVDEVGPAGLVDIAGVAVERGRVSIPFLQPLSGDAAIDLRASLTLERDADRVVWQLPVPRADLVGPASVFVASASDIELLPDGEAIRGLERQVPASLPPPAGEQPPLLYRLDAPEGTFAAGRRFLPQRIDSAIGTLADVGREELLIEQMIELRVAHVPLESLDLVVPREVAATGTLEVRQDGAPLDVAAASGDRAEDAPATDGAVRLRLPLALPLLGRGLLEVRYRLPAPRVPAAAPAKVQVPLVMPGGTRVLRQSLEVRAADPLGVDVSGDAWKREPGPTAAAGLRTWSAPRKQTVVPLVITARDRVTAAGLVIEAAWLRSRLEPGRREDHYVYALRSTAERVALTLPAPPPGSVPESCEVALDGAVVPTATLTDGRIVVELPEPAAHRLLEIRTVTRGLDRRRALALPVPVELAAPVFDGEVRERRFFWEVCCLPDEHLLGVPKGWTSQQVWAWQSWGPARVANVTSAQIARHVRAAAGAAEAPASEPPIASTRVVFSGVGSPGRTVLWLVPDWVLVLVASGVSLAVGLTALRRPWLRRLPVVVALAALVTLAAVGLPDAAPPVITAALPGVGLALFAAFVEAAPRLRLPTRAPQPAPGHAGASSLTRQVSPSVSLVVADSLPAARPQGGESASVSGGRLP